MDCSGHGRCNVEDIDGDIVAVCQCENTFIQSNDRRDCECPAGTFLNVAVNRCFSSPTTSPTENPTLTATSSPTFAPTITPTVAGFPDPSCEVDNPTFEFELVNTGGRRSCSWINQNSERKEYRRSIYCYNDHACGEVSEIGNACKQACGLCEENETDPCGEKCESSSDATFNLNNGMSASCSWISKNWLKRDFRRNTYCYNDDCSPTSIGHTCYEACGFCDGTWQNSCGSTSSPSESPVVPPTIAIVPDDCQDLSEFTFPLLSASDPLDSSQRRNCEWLTRNNQKKQTRLDNYCSFTHVRSACRQSCNHCVVEDKEGTEIFARLNPDDNGDIIQLGCSWLTKNSGATEQRKSNYCFADDVCETASIVGDCCPVACGFANGSNEKRQCPMTSRPTFLPTTSPTKSPTFLPTTKNPTPNVSFKQ